MAKLPEIRIRHSRLLTEAVSRRLYALDKGADAELADNDILEQRAEEYRVAWLEHEAAVLAALTESLGLDYYQPVIDVTLAPWIRSMSTPLIINYRAEPDQFVDILAHELIHVLISDNTQKIDFRELMTREWPAEAPRAQVHVLVHAVLENLYVSVLKQPERLARDIESNRDNPPYARAWAIVGEQGSAKIIELMRSFADLAKPKDD